MSAALVIPHDVVLDAAARASLEWRLTNELAFGLTTASPLQRAICRIADGKPLGKLALDPAVQRAVGNVLALPHGKRPRELAILSGIRVAKSLIAACLAVHWALTCDLSKLGPGEIPRISIVSLIKDLADVVYNHIAGRMKQSPLLAPFLAAEPSGESILVRHPSGRLVEIKVVAGSRAGATLVARWSAGCIFDEFPRMVGGDDAVVNWKDMHDAILLRLLPGAQIVDIGSPWAPYGPAYDMVHEHHGKPTEALVVIRAPAPDMNPVFWTPERVEAAKTDPDAYRTDVLAEFASPEASLFNAATVDACFRKEPAVLAPVPGHTYFAAMDPATRGNGWTLVVGTREGGRTRIVLAKEWRGNKAAPLDPAEVLAEIAGTLAAYGVDSVDSDQWMGDALVSLGDQVGLSIVICRYTERQRAEMYLAARTRLESGEIELAPVPRLRSDLLQVRKRVTPAGVSVVLPQTSDGRHCDYAPALMLVLARILP
ncbi:MAG TPA: hypothetical protein VEA38_15105, partial [Terriglobales bacterium]|nr:hypothetical protein [Terriglobales bacterium]